MKYTEEGKSVKRNVGLARVSVLCLAPTESLGPRKTLFTGFLFPTEVRYRSRIRRVTSSQSFKQVSEDGRLIVVINSTIKPD